MPRAFSKLDQLLIGLQYSVLKPPSAVHATPAAHVAESALLPDEKKMCAGLMRVNHTGEVCAQALYLGQALVAKQFSTQQHLLHAAEEERDHLAWCAERLEELDSHTSVLNIVFFNLSLLTGMIAGLASDKISLGFIAETEKQVTNHLTSHLAQLPVQDHKSRAIISQMQLDEIKHQTEALQAGGEELPAFIKDLMQYTSKLMTATTYYW